MIGLLILFGIALGLLTALLTAMLAWQMVHPPRHTAAWALARGLPCDPNDLNLKFDEWWLDRPGGARLPVWEIEGRKKSEVRDQRAADSNTLTAVFIHGWGHARVDSLQRIDPFLPLVDRMVLYDLRGHGDSTGSASTLGDGEDEDLRALLERLGDGPFLLVGHSMGAVIALRAATKAVGQSSSVAQLISGLIAYGPYCDFHRSLQGRLHVNGLPARPLTDLALLIHRLRGVRPAGIAPQILQGLHIPLLVVHGVNDRVSPLDHARRIADAAAGATLIEVEDAAHADSHSVDAARHEESIRQFVARLCARSSVTGAQVNA